MKSGAMRSGALAVLLLAAFTAMLLYSTPVITLFTGSHSAIPLLHNDTTGIITAGGNEYCRQCHSRVWNELYSNPNAPHYDLSCETCHRFNGTGITFAVHNSTGVYPGKQAHAAYVPRCLDCHGNGVYVVNRFGSVVYAPPARAFNLSPIPYAAAHKKLIEYANNTLGDMNVGCLACHANYSSTIDFSYHYNLNYTLSAWTFWSFAPNGTRNYLVSVSKAHIFSGKHGFVPVQNITCSKCHENVYEALVNGTGSYYFTHAPVEIPDNLGLTAWGTTNLWGDPRYHYVPPAYRAAWVNNTYCNKCHNNPGVNSTAAYRDEVHCAEKVSCLTCHGYEKPYDPYYVIGTGSRSSDAAGHRTLLNATADYARMYHGDVCMGCHEAAVHPLSGSCSSCHQQGSVSVYIESEPSGYATNS